MTTSNTTEFLERPPLIPESFWLRGLVCQRGLDGVARTNIAQKIISHSPTGFEWGYGGSGPADLALNVLQLLLPGTEVRVLNRASCSELAWNLHQLFKEEVIAEIPRGGGTVPLGEIKGWIRACRPAVTFPDERS